jgi:ATP-dependent DNA helicase 2 subunit 2
MVSGHYYMAGVDVIVPAPDDPKAAIAIGAFVKTCIDRKEGILVRFVKRQNSAPKLCFLVPFMDTDGGNHNLGFYCNQLPFAEDMRPYVFPAFSRNPKFDVSTAQRKAARDLISSLDLSASDPSDDQLNPEFTFNPSVQRFYACLEARALDPEAPLQPLDPAIKAYVEPDARLFAGAAGALSEFAEQFPLTVRSDSAAGGKKRRPWRELIDLETTAEKKPKLDEHAPDVKLQDMLVETVTEIGTADPLGDFTTMLTQRQVGDRTVLPAAVTQMWSRVEGLLSKAIRNHTFGPAITIILAIRTACTQVRVCAFCIFDPDLCLRAAAQEPSSADR